MIIFAPGYDPATRANLAVARELVSGEDLALLGGEATRSKLLDSLRANEGRPLFSMSHGKSAHFCGQGGEPALCSQDAGAVGPRAVYIFACHTASRLGYEMCQVGVTWWGYTGAIQCPEDAGGFRGLFVDLFGYIRGAFGRASSAAERRAVIEEVARRCEAAQELVDEGALGDPDLDVMSAYHCLLHLWDRLRVWPPYAAEPERHERAQPPSLFLAE
jgi:hypothetical protein